MSENPMIARGVHGPARKRSHAASDWVGCTIKYKVVMIDFTSKE